MRELTFKGFLTQYVKELSYSGNIDIAALAAEGVSSIESINFVKRGYEDFVNKLQHLGADIHIEYSPEEPEGSDKITAIS